jgi:hypothetical protein
MFPESFNILTQQPEEAQLEKYVITDEWGQTFYIHCKVLYEEISEEFLFNNYHIRKAPHRKESKGGLLPFIYKMRNNNPSKVIKKTLPKRRITTINLTKKNARRKESALLNVQRVASPVMRRVKKERKNSLFKCLDEMDVRGTPYSKFNIKARHAFDQSQPNNTQIQNMKYFVPVALCIKTKNPSYNSADQLLLALIDILYVNQNLYIHDTENLIYSYSEFVSHVLMLTHIISPPPITNYEIDVGLNDVYYTEGGLTEFISENDTIPMQLFSLLSIESVITMWTALLLDMRVILYVENTNDYFFLIKGLNQLMFPLRWEYSKGILPEPSLLLQPVPYVYGVMRTLFPNKNEIFTYLLEEEVPYIFLDVSDSVVSLSSSDVYPLFPGQFSLSKQLKNIFHNLGTNELLKLSEKKQIELSRKVRVAFLKELTPYVKDIEKVIKETKTNDFYVFGTAYVENFEKQKTSATQSEFLKELVQSQAFAVLFDEVCMQTGGNYSRFKTMRLRDKLLLDKPVQITLLSSQSIVLSRVSRLIERVSKENLKQKVNKNDSYFVVLDRVKIDWMYEIYRMQKVAVQKKVFRRGSDEMYYARSNTERFNAPIQDDTLYYTQCNKPQIKRGIFKSVTASIRGMKQMKLGKPRTGTLFYGPKGFLAFCQELFCLNNNQKNFISLVQDIKPFLDKLRNEHATNKSQSVIDSTEINSTKDVSYSTPQVHSRLISALIDAKSLAKFNIGGKCEEPLMKFSLINSCQFFLFCAMYYNKYYENPYEITKVLHFHYVSAT